MVEAILKNIIDYAYYLKSLGLNVSFCDPVFNFENHMHILLPHNSHNSPYCLCVKSNHSSLMTCVQKQRKVFERSKKGEFFGVCWAGVQEYVFPINDGDTTLAFVSVSGYKGALHDAAAKIKAVSKKFQIDEKTLLQTHSKLRTAHSLPFLRSVIYPFCNMFTLLYLKNDKKLATTESSSAYSEILNYLCANYQYDIVLKDISCHCHYSESYIRHLFKQKSGYTLRDYIAKLRVAHAKQLLLNTDITVTEIASIIGYNEPNYFTNVFRKNTGVSPRAFRAKNLKHK